MGALLASAVGCSSQLAAHIESATDADAGTVAVDAGLAGDAAAALPLDLAGAGHPLDLAGDDGAGSLDATDLGMGKVLYIHLISFFDPSEEADVDGFIRCLLGTSFGTTWAQQWGLRFVYLGPTELPDVTVPDPLGVNDSAPALIDQLVAQGRLAAPHGQNDTIYVLLVPGDVADGGVQASYSKGDFHLVLCRTDPEAACGIHLQTGTYQTALIPTGCQTCATLTGSTWSGNLIHAIVEHEIAEAAGNLSGVADFEAADECQQFTSGTCDGLVQPLARPDAPDDCEAIE